MLVLKLLLDILVPQEHLLELEGALLLLLTLPGLDPLLQSVHLVSLLLYELLLECELLPLPHVLEASKLLLLHLVAADLDGVSLGVVLLLGQVPLDLPQVEQLGGGLEDVGQRLLQLLGLLLQLPLLGLLLLLDQAQPVLLKLIHPLIPGLVELIELHDVGLLKLEHVVLLSDVELVDLFVLLLLLELGDPVLGHLGLNVLALDFTLLLVLQEDVDVVIDVAFAVFVRILVLVLIHGLLVLVGRRVSVLVLAGSIHFIIISYS